MKLKIKPYIITLVKENIIYIVSGVLAILLIFFFISLNADKIPENDKKINSLSKDIQTLQAQLSIINSVEPNRNELDTDIKFLNTLIPDAEDYFSIIYTIEALSQKTNFLITSYTINLKASTANRLSLDVNGIGDRTTFLNFLKNYNFEGGRLVTSNKIDIETEAASGIKINLAFYNKKPAVEKTLSISQAPKSLAEVAALRNKVQFTLKEASSESGIGYPTKSTLF